MSNLEFFAVFAVVKIDNGFAATTRPEGNIGLPGGKVDAGERPDVAVYREAFEEGWLLDGCPTLIHTATVHGRLVGYYAFDSATMLHEFKEKGRISPIVASAEALNVEGFGNAFLKDLSIQSSYS